MIINKPAMPTSNGLANGFPVSSSPAPKSIGKIIQSALMVANVLLFIRFYFFYLISSRSFALLMIRSTSDAGTIFLPYPLMVFIFPS